MEFILLSVGKTKINFINEGIKHYLNRLKHYIQLSLIELPDVKNIKVNDRLYQKNKEGELILDKLSPSDMVIILDEKGKEFTSIELASYIEKISLTGRKRIVFIIGGPFGFSDSVYKRADAKLSLSRLTFNHEMVRLFFVEQIYRAMTIVRGEPYHHD